MNSVIMNKFFICVCWFVVSVTRKVEMKSLIQNFNVYNPQDNSRIAQFENRWSLQCPGNLIPHDGCCFCLQGQQYYEDIDRYPHHRCSGTTIASEFTATATPEGSLYCPFEMILHEGYCYCPQDHTFDSYFKKCVRAESSALDEGYENSYIFYERSQDVSSCMHNIYNSNKISCMGVNCYGTSGFAGTLGAAVYYQACPLNKVEHRDGKCYDCPEGQVYRRYFNQCRKEPNGLKKNQF